MTKTPNSKVCSDCGVRKQMDQFYKNHQKDRPNSPVRPECKKCTTKRRKAA